MTGVDVDAKDRNGTSALHWAAFAGSTDLVRFLVASGANTGAQDNEGAVALHRAVQAYVEGKALPMVAALSDRHSTSHFCAPLHVHPYERNHAGLVGVMIDHPMYRMGMQFYARDKQNRTPLKLARVRMWCRNNMCCTRSVNTRCCIHVCCLCSAHRI